MHSLLINGLQVEFPQGTTLLAACRKLGIPVPTLCHDERLRPIGACRLCVVEVDGQSNLVSACNTQVADGMSVRTDSPRIAETRTSILEWLAENFPLPQEQSKHDTPFEQLLRDHGLRPGNHTSHPCVSEAPTPAPFKDFTHPYLQVDMSRCVTCFRCVRICDEVQGANVWEAYGRGDQTQIRPLRSSLSDSGCVSCGACADTCPSGAITDRPRFHSGEPVQWTRTVCPYCGTGCEMQVGVQADRIVQVRPALDALVNRGHLCVKGRYAHGFVDAADRVTSPQVRNPDGSWKQVTWDEAIQQVANRLKSTIQNEGPQTVGILSSARGTNEENYLVQKFARVVVGTNNVDCCARVCHAPTAEAMGRMLGTGAATNSFDDIERSDCFLLVGCNPSESHPIVGARIKQAARRGAKLVVIDPRVTELAQVADIHLAIRPGTNVPVLNAMLQVIQNDGWVKEEHCATRWEGWEHFKKAIQEWTPERAAEICGVEPGLIRKAARAYAQARSAMSFHGLGVTEHSQGTDTVELLVQLALITGHLGKPGTGVNPLRGQNNVQGAAHMGCEPSHLTGFALVEKARDFFEAQWKTRIPVQPGMDLTQMLEAARMGDLKLLWCIGYDVAQTHSNSQQTLQDLSRIPCIIVQDLFMTETARQFAHIFLPACSSFEKDGTFMNSERRVQRVRQCVEPRGESRPDWRIVCDIAHAMGFGDAFHFDSCQSIWEEIRSVWPAGQGMTYDRLERSGLQWPCPDESHPGTAILHQASETAPTRRKVRVVPYVPTVEATHSDYPFLLTTGRTLYQFNAGTMTLRTPNASLQYHDRLELSPVDAERLSIRTGDWVKLKSRHGEARLFAQVDERTSEGQLFATFHHPESELNQLTSSCEDGATHTPEYKVVAVNITKSSPPATPTTSDSPSL